MSKHAVSALVAVGLLACAQVSLAQTPRPENKDDDVTPLIERSQDAPKSKSDAYRLVGKVLEIDKAGGAVKLATDEGERVVKPNAQLLAAIRVGDMISVPRSEEPPVNASPAATPRMSPPAR
jgi:hypothetical protein